ncbi:hypothetical protein ACMX2H_18270, partial [Arthrobacter sulfonylureivorans]|uniref:hypothetical protein n=1 Tax=Arthrobacter sulfonylureivorans TaxID=2486855 RepID=UPI0039E69CE0
MEQNQAPEWAVVGAEAYIENRSSYEDRIGAKVVITKVLKTCVVVEGENHNGKFERRYRIEWNGSLVRTKKAGADEYVDENHWRRDRLVSL